MLLKNTKIISVFIIGVLILSILIFQWNTFKGKVQGDTFASNGSLIVYDDQLQSGFSNWSWGSTTDFSASSPVYAGSKAIGFTPSAWGALYLHTENTLDLSQYSSLHFYMLPNQPGQSFKIVFYDSNGQAKTTLPLSNYNPNPSINTWNAYNVPVTDIALSQIKGFAIQDASGKAQPVIYLDDIEFVKSVDTASANSSVVRKDIYAEGLQNGWTSWSWDSSINFDNSYPVNQGSKSISYTPNAAWGGLYLHNDSGIDTTNYNVLTFAAKASKDDQKFAVLLFDTNNQTLNAPVALDTYSGQPVSSAWKTYTIPLRDLNGTNRTIKGFGIFDLTGHSQPTLFLDDIALVGQSFAGLPSPMPTVSAAVAQAKAQVTPSVTPSVTPTSAPVALAAPVSGGNAGNPLSGANLFNNPDSNPAQAQADQWRSSRPADADAMAKIAGQAKATWMGGWSGDIHAAVQSMVDKASGAGAVPVMIAYNIPNRDCGGYSAGGTGSMQAYQDWINGFASGIGSRKAVVVLEPDALAGETCLQGDALSQRHDMLKYAVQKLKSLGNTAVYLDAGHAGWVGASDMANRLKQGGIDQADGFALNVSNFGATGDQVNYGQQISSQVGGKHFIVDTSRNGNGSDGDNWCNPSGRALGDKPTTNTGNPVVDGYLWLKYPGESDGSCNGGPSAGQWYPDYALNLAKSAKW